MKDQALYCRVDQKTKDRLAAASAREQLSMSEIIRRLVDEHITEKGNRRGTKTKPKN